MKTKRGCNTDAKFYSVKARAGVLSAIFVSRTRTLLSRYVLVPYRIVFLVFFSG